MSKLLNFFIIIIFVFILLLLFIGIRRLDVRNRLPAQITTTTTQPIITTTLPAQITTTMQTIVTTIPKSNQNPFGIMLTSSFVPTQKGVEIAKTFGVVYFRPESVFIDRWDGTCKACDIINNADLKLVLTIRNNGGGLSPTTPPTDLSVYQSKIGEILDKYHPVLLVVENEENSNLFYVGTPEEYGNQLRAACEVSHQKNIPCTNGGLVSKLVALLVYNHYKETGNLVAAQDFASRVFNTQELQELNSSKAQQQIDKGKALLQAYRDANMDYINFHWYIADTKALEEAVNYLNEQTNLPVITNEVGQFTDDPDQTTSVMNKIVELKLPIAVWFAQDGPQARGLVNTDGSLRPTGEAFKSFIEQNLN